MEKRNVRYGIVNTMKRERYEREFHLPYGYEYITYEKAKAIVICRKKNDSNYIVEEIFNTTDSINYKQEIYRSGGEK
jgi:inorganic pyrophosphatase/exopolyphosphatase